MTIKVAYHGRERKCPICGKTYILYENWAYRKQKGQTEQIFCSWKCLRDYELTAPTRGETNKRIIQAIRDGLTNAEIAKLLGVYARRVDYWRKKLEREDEGNDQEGKDQEGT